MTGKTGTTYLVGGAVRDELLGLPVKEKDWVVVGSTPEAMSAEGFRPVGKDFPVFLHPKTQEEYALARSEKKVGKGYKGFVFHTDPDVTLEADLHRRDLTINAMAKAKDGAIIDPYHGQDDLKAKRFRHVSAAFAEDPVRILRLARFAAKLPDFTVDPKTNILIQKMVENGEVDALVSERVWKECERALEETSPIRFFDVLKDGDALEKLFPELNDNNNGLECLKIATSASPDGTIRFAALLSKLSPQSIKTLCQRLRVPKQYADLAQLTATLVPLYETLDTQNAEDLLHWLKKADALRREKRFEQLLRLMRICVPEKDITEILQVALNAIASVDIQPIHKQQLAGEDFAIALKKLHIDAIHKNLTR